MKDFFKKLMSDSNEVSFMRFACGVLLGAVIVMIGFIIFEWAAHDKDPSKLETLVEFLVAAIMAGKVGQKFAEK